MEGLNDLEQAVLDKLLAGDHPRLAILRAQAASARLASHETTGVGFFCIFDIPTRVASMDVPDFTIDDVDGELQGLAHGAGFVLFVHGGRLKMLEGFSYDEPWPEQIRDFSLRYTDPKREEVLSKLG
ncbi:MAG TPA: hypothetical protein VGI10_29905 [Polyangiaceae bacterium]|jgi:hypothetical protein